MSLWLCTIRLGLKLLFGTNALAYFPGALVKNPKTMVPETCNIKLFTTVIYKFFVIS